MKTKTLVQFGLSLIAILALAPQARCETPTVLPSTQHPATNMYIPNETSEIAGRTIIARVRGKDANSSFLIDIIKLTDEPKIQYKDIQVFTDGSKGERIALPQLSPRLIVYTEFLGGSGGATATGFYKLPQIDSPSSIHVVWNGSTVTFRVERK